MNYNEDTVDHDQSLDGESPTDGSEEMDIVPVNTTRATGISLGQTCGPKVTAMSATSSKKVSLDVDSMECDGDDSAGDESESDSSSDAPRMLFVALPTSKSCGSSMKVLPGSHLYGSLIRKYKSSTSGLTRFVVEIEDPSEYLLFLNNIEDTGPLTFQEAKTLLPLSMKFHKKKLQTRCLAALVRDATNENALELKNLALKVKNEELSKLADSKLKVNPTILPSLTEEKSHSTQVHGVCLRGAKHLVHLMTDSFLKNYILPAAKIPYQDLRNEVRGYTFKGVLRKDQIAKTILLYGHDFNGAYTHKRWAHTIWKSSQSPCPYASPGPNMKLVIKTAKASDPNQSCIILSKETVKSLLQNIHQLFEEYVKLERLLDSLHTQQDSQNGLS